MTDPKLYEHTYWNHKGKYPDIQDALSKLVPEEGVVFHPKDNPALETFRVASNCYYDLYNNGLCNRAEEFEKVFGFEGPYREYGPEEDDDDRRSYNENDEAWWTQANINRVEDAINRIILAAAKEQGIALSEGAEAQAEVDRLSAKLASNHEKLTKIVKGLEAKKPKVQLTGEDGNVFSIIGRVSKALKQNGQGDKAKEFSTKAMHADSYESVLRLAMEYCEVG